MVAKVSEEHARAVKEYKEVVMEGEAWKAELKSKIDQAIEHAP